MLMPKMFYRRSAGTSFLAEQLPLLPTAYPIDIHKDKEIIVLEVYSVWWPDDRGYLLDNVVPFHGVVVPYRCPNRELVKE